MNNSRVAKGFTLIEMMVTMAVGALMLGAVARIMQTTSLLVAQTESDTRLQRDANFAMNRMVRAIERAQYGFLPLGENPSTPHSESVRALLAVSMDPTLDRDKDGWSDANNDRDWHDYDNDGVRDAHEPERIDEDPGHDLSNDGAAGIVGVDDDNDGAVDELMEYDDPVKSAEDDDEDGWKNDDNANGYDDDNDGAIDEDWKQEVNDDHAPGQKGRDDNYDGLIDDHPAYPNGGDSKEARRDDDEDGVWNEDGPETVLYYLGATEVYDTSGAVTPTGEAYTLYERIADAAAPDGNAFSNYPIATGVRSFQVERLAPIFPHDEPIFRISLELFDTNGNELMTSRTVRLGGRR